MMLIIQIVKFKFRQYQMRAISPNLMLVKVTCYMVLNALLQAHFHPAIQYCVSFLVLCVTIQCATLKN